MSILFRTEPGWPGTDLEAGPDLRRSAPRPRTASYAPRRRATHPRLMCNPGTQAIQLLLRNNCRVVPGLSIGQQRCLLGPRCQFAPAIGAGYTPWLDDNIAECGSERKTGGSSGG